VQQPPLHEPFHLELHARVDELVEVPVRVSERQRIGVDEMARDEKVDLGRQGDEGWPRSLWDLESLLWDGFECGWFLRLSGRGLNSDPGGSRDEEG